jgi:hypothetical protein
MLSTVRMLLTVFGAFFGQSVLQPLDVFVADGVEFLVPQRPLEMDP